jgi:putative radical SAM enzyme (TIGR03279 family)
MSDGVIIKAVASNSVGAEMGLEPGDRLLCINGRPPSDFIDYLCCNAESRLQLTVETKDGERLELEIEKEPEESLGLVFEDIVFDGIRSCDNHCLFCFVHQMPVGQRDSLYIMDDDYRLSFLQGAYITLTNLAEEDWQRIEELRLSPLYISVHATDPAVRAKLLGSKKAASVIKELERLAAAGITVHTQAVLCPGINDGKVLEQTIADLAGLWPQVASLAIVPVGLTGHRSKLHQLSGFTAVESRQLIGQVTTWQEKLLPELGSRFVFAADEWYVAAALPLPSDAEYEDYLQLDNGVGLVRRFLTELEENWADYRPHFSGWPASFTIITGESAREMWQEVQKNFQRDCPEVKLQILAVQNCFFGPSVTVTGLLAGADIQKTILNHDSSPETVFLVPEITLKQGERLFLDNQSFDEVAAACRPREIKLVPTSAADWLEWMANMRRSTHCPEL